MLIVVEDVETGDIVEATSIDSIFLNEGYYKPLKITFELEDSEFGELFNEADIS